MSEFKINKKRLSIALVGGLATTALLTGCSGSEKAPSENDHGADRVSQALYDTGNFAKGVPVPGVINGSVTVEDAAGKVIWKNPAVLAFDQGSKIDGSWIGVPAYDSNGHVHLQAVRLALGVHGDQTETLQLSDSAQPVLYGAALYPTTVANAPDSLVAFDINGNGNFASVTVSASAEK